METGREEGRGAGISYSKIFGKKLAEMAERDEKIVAISAAMTEGTGLASFGRKFPERALWTWESPRDTP